MSDEQRRLRAVSSFFDWRALFTWPLRYPSVAFVLALILAALAAAAVSHLRSDASLQAVFSRNSPSAKALVRISEDFSAADDLIVLASLPDSKSGADPDRLLGVAKRLEDQVSHTPAAVAMCDGVFYHPDTQTMEFFQKVLVPSAVFYLDDASFAAAQKRLTLPEMRRQIEQDQAMLAAPGPAAGAMAKAFMRDPLRLREFLLDRLAHQNPMKTRSGSDAFISPDGRTILIRVRGRRPPSDLDFCTEFTRTITSCATRANNDALKLQFTGSYAIAAYSAQSIRSDMIASVIGSVICLQALFLLAYRRALRLFALALTPIALGVLLGFGAYACFRTGITPLSAVLGGVLAGMAIDYSIQYLSHYYSRRLASDEPRIAAQSAFATITPAAFAAWLTSIIGFAAVGASSVKMLRDFSILGTLGLAGAFLAVVFLLPMLMMLWDLRGKPKTSRSGAEKSRSIFRWTLVPMLRWIAARSRLCMIVSIALLFIGTGVLIANHGRLLTLESDLTAMHPRPNPALEAQGELSKKFGISPDSIIIHLQADSQPRLLELAHDVDVRLKSTGDAEITSTYGLATLLPDPRVTGARITAIGEDEANRVVADFRLAMTDAGFSLDAKPIQDYQNFLRVLLMQRKAPTIDDLLLYRQLAETMLPRGAFEGKPATEAMTLVFLSGDLSDRGRRDHAVQSVRQALAGLSGATPTGLSVVGYDTEAAVRHDLPRLVLLAVIAVAAYLAIHFRSVPDALLAMLPTVFGLVILLAAMRLAGQKLNMINLVAIPLLIGIDVDYGVFLVSLARVKNARQLTRTQLVNRLAPVCHAVVICALATMIGFGSLAWTSVPAVRSLGFAVAVGIASCLFSVLFLVTPIFFGLTRTEECE